MGEIIHARTTAEGPRFREWLTVTDTYTTPPLDRAAMEAHLLEVRHGDPHYPPARRVALEEIARRLDRAAERGTSAYDRRPVALDAPWETERCRRCGGFHHAFVGGAGGACAWCDDAREDPVHGPPCEGGAG